MWMFDRYTIGGILVLTAIGFFVALILGRRTQWSKRRIKWIAASPLPGLAAALAVVVFVQSIISPAERCGVDACAMAAMAAFLLLSLAGIAFILSAVAAEIGYWISRR